LAVIPFSITGKVKTPPYPGYHEEIRELAWDIDNVFTCGEKSLLIFYLLPD